MTLELPKDPSARRLHRRKAGEVKRALREVNNQVALLNHLIGAKVALRSYDLDCLDLLGIHGPLSPSELARRTGIHRATVTGILDRLERDGWVRRERDEEDRRAVVVRARPERSGDLARHYAEMSASMDEICGDYSAAELELLRDFLCRTAEAGRVAADGPGDR